jgi:hypothetical protein
MFNKMSTRQKSKALIAVLGLPGEDKDALDAVISEYVGHPLIGAFTGTDVTSVESLVGLIVDKSKDADDETLSTLANVLKNEKVRSSIAGGFTTVVSKLDPGLQQSVVTAISNISEMDVPEFNHTFQDIEHFVRDGLLQFVANTKQKQITSEKDFYVCPECGHIGV